MEIGGEDIHADLNSQKYAKIFSRFSKAVAHSGALTSATVNLIGIHVGGDIERYILDGEEHRADSEEKHEHLGTGFVEWFLEQAYRSFWWVYILGATKFLPQQLI